MAASTTATEIVMTSYDFISLIININQSLKKLKYPEAKVFLLLGTILSILWTRSWHPWSYLSMTLSLPDDLLDLVKLYFDLFIVHPESK